MRGFLRQRLTLAAAASAVATAVALGAGAGAAQAVAAPAQKDPLTQTNRNCDGSLIGPALTQAFGFAVITKTGNNGLVVEVVLKHAVPNTTYNIRVIQLVPDGSDCGSFILGPFDGTVTTDALGDGNTNIREPVLAGASSVFVDLNGQANPSDFFTTAVVHF
jgi:hypothetical protein